jgi:hypothetical protein
MILEPKLQMINNKSERLLFRFVSALTYQAILLHKRRSQEVMIASVDCDYHRSFLS